ncbi:hypothetical protein ACO1CY_00005 [Bacillus velezensis]
MVEAKELTGLPNFLPTVSAQLKKWLEDKGLSVSSLAKDKIEELIEKTDDASVHRSCGCGRRWRKPQLKNTWRWKKPFVRIVVFVAAILRGQPDPQMGRALDPGTELTSKQNRGPGYSKDAFEGWSL